MTNIKSIIKKNWKWIFVFMLPWPILVMVAAYKGYIVYRKKDEKHHEKSNENQT